MSTAAIWARCWTPTPSQRAGSGKRIDDAVGLYIMSEIAEGVHFAHELRGGDGNPLGLVHRDISPSNILLSYAGEVKLSDFGVAKRNADSSVVTSLKGELGYISPEQARGAPTDRRSDIFSLGAVAFEIFTGSPLRTLSGSPDDYLKAASGIVPRPSATGRTFRPPSSACSPARWRPIRATASPTRASSSMPAARPWPRFHGRRAARRASSRTCSRRCCPRAPSRNSKLPSKVISLMPSLWEDVTVPDSPMPPVMSGPPLPSYKRGRARAPSPQARPRRRRHVRPPGGKKIPPRLVTPRRPTLA
jgi:serine/threonine protein kinase